MLEASKENEAKKQKQKTEKKASADDIESELLDEDKEEVFDVQLREALRIMGDWISIFGQK